MSQPTEVRGREGWWLAASIAAFVLFPVGVPKFLFLGAGLWLAGRVFGRAAWSVGCAAFAAALFATTFLLTPVCAAQALRATGETAGASLPVQLALLAFGAGWVWLAIAPPPPVLARTGTVRWRFALLWPLLLVGAYFLPWEADIAYGGDEHYHLKSLVVSRLLTGELLRHSGFALAGLVWLGVGVWLAARGSTFQCRVDGTRGAGARPPGKAGGQGSTLECLAAGWALAGLALAACAPWLYPAAMLDDAFNQDRMLRYPGSQP